MDIFQLFNAMVTSAAPALGQVLSLANVEYSALII